MVFNNEKIIIGEKKDKTMYLFRKIENEIIMYFIHKDGKSFESETIVDDSYGEFDIAFLKEDIYIVYQNDEGNLIVSSIGNTKKIEKIKIRNKIYELNTLSFNGELHIFFSEGSNQDKNKFNINHLICKEEEIESSIIDTVEINNIINPIKIVAVDAKIYIAYYFSNQICLKEYNLYDKEYTPSITLTDNKNKLYLDMIIIEDNLHLVYSNYKDENFAIIYEKYLIKAEILIKTKEERLSQMGNNTDPIIVYHLKNLWIIWKSTNKLLSKKSTDLGDSFSEEYTWKESYDETVVKYKYITNELYENIKIDNSYGLYPEIKFLGFE